MGLLAGIAILIIFLAFLKRVCTEGHGKYFKDYKFIHFKKYIIVYKSPFFLGLSISLTGFLLAFFFQCRQIITYLIPKILNSQHAAWACFLVLLFLFKLSTFFFLLLFYLLLYSQYLNIERKGYG